MELWITNITNKQVSVFDLNVKISAYSSINIYSKHYHHTKEEVEASVKSGSVYNNIKRKRLAIREVSPKIITDRVSIMEDAIIPDRGRSLSDVKEENYEELNVDDSISDEQFALDNVDLVD